MAGNGSLGRLKAKVKASLARRGGAPSGSHGPSDAVADAADGVGESNTAADDHAGTGGIAVSYAPERDGDADPGEVVWAWVPYEEDPSQGKDRPVLVLGWDGPQLAAVQLSSKDHSQRDDARDWVPVGRGAWDRENRPSYADASRLLRLDPSSVRREGAALHEDRFTELLDRVSRLHDWSARDR